MPLTDDQRTRVTYHLSAMSVNWGGFVVGGLPTFREATHVLETAMTYVTDRGAAVVALLLADLDAVRAKLNDADTLQLSQVREVKLRDDGVRVLAQRYAALRRELLNVLGIPEHKLSPENGGGIVREP